MYKCYSDQSPSASQMLDSSDKVTFAYNNWLYIFIAAHPQ